jgi:soluble lytic murein transglycosylase
VRKVWLIVFVSAGLFLATVVLQYLRVRHWMSENRYDPIILRAAAEYGVDPNLVKAVILRESKFDSKTVGTVGERGLMQVTEPAAEEWVKACRIEKFKPDHLFDPETNIRAGTWYLMKSIKNWKHAEDPIPMALAEYNAGRKNVLRWVDEKSIADPDHFIDRIGFSSTQQYVRTVLAQRKFYENTGEF